MSLFEATRLVVVLEPSHVGVSVLDQLEAHMCFFPLNPRTFPQGRETQKAYLPFAQQGKRNPEKKTLADLLVLGE